MQSIKTGHKAPISSPPEDRNGKISRPLSSPPPPRIISQVWVLGKEWLYSGVQVYFGLHLGSCFPAHCMFRPPAFHMLLTSLFLPSHLSLFLSPPLCLCLYERLYRLSCLSSFLNGLLEMTSGPQSNWKWKNVLAHILTSLSGLHNSARQRGRNDLICFGIVVLFTNKCGLR